MQTIDLVKCVNVFLEKNVFKFSFFLFSTQHVLLRTKISVNEMTFMTAQHSMQKHLKLRF